MCHARVEEMVPYEVVIDCPHCDLETVECVAKSRRHWSNDLGSERKHIGPRIGPTCGVEHRQNPGRKQNYQ